MCTWARDRYPRHFSTKTYIHSLVFLCWHQAKRNDTKSKMQAFCKASKQLTKLFHSSQQVTSCFNLLRLLQLQFCLDMYHAMGRVDAQFCNVLPIRFSLPEGFELLSTGNQESSAIFPRKMETAWRVLFAHYWHFLGMIFLKITVRLQWQACSILSRNIKASQNIQVPDSSFWSNRFKSTLMPLQL